MRVTRAELVYLRLRLAAIKSSVHVCHRQGDVESMAIYLHRQFELEDFIRRHQ